MTTALKTRCLQCPSEVVEAYLPNDEPITLETVSSPRLYEVIYLVHRDTDGDLVAVRLRPAQIPAATAHGQQLYRRHDFCV